MEKIVVNVSWCDKNFGASLSENVPGAIVITAKSYDELVDEVRETLNFHVEGMIADGDDVPQWLREGDHELEYHLVNQHQLSHYANGIKKPRPEQRRRIIEGIHKIGRELIAIE